MAMLERVAAEEAGVEARGAALLRPRSCARCRLQAGGRGGGAGRGVSRGCRCAAAAVGARAACREPGTAAVGRRA